MSAEDRIDGDVIGFRQWRVTPDLQLRAAHKRQAVWTPGVNEAKCHKTADDLLYSLGGDSVPCEHAPGSDCECGMYALHSPDDFWYGKDSKRNVWTFALGGTTDTDPLVAGVVAAWGALEVHHSGFRAQYARIVALATPKGKRDAVVAKAVADAYGVPLVSADMLPRIAAEFGSTVPEAMRPEKPEPKTGEFTFNGGRLSSQMYQQLLYGTAARPASGGRVFSHSIQPVTSGSFHYFDAAVKSTKTTVDDLAALIDKYKAPAQQSKTRGQIAAELVAKQIGHRPLGPKYDHRAFLPKRHGGLT